MCWSPPASLVGGTSRDDDLRIASSDIGGFIVISHVLSGEKRTEFRHANSYPLGESLSPEQVSSDLRWFVWKDLARDFVLALHSSRQVVLWNADTGDRFVGDWDIDSSHRVWIHTYQVPVFLFDLNPHNTCNVACEFSLSSSECSVSSVGNTLLVVEDMSLQPAPSSSGHLLRLPVEASPANDASHISTLRFHLGFMNLLFVACRDQVCLPSPHKACRSSLWKRSHG